MSSLRQSARNGPGDTGCESVALAQPAFEPRSEAGLDEIRVRPISHLVPLNPAWEEAWNCEDESRFLVWLVRCSDRELDDFIQDCRGPSAYLGDAQAERQCRQRERSRCPCWQSLSALLESWTASFSRFARTFHEPPAPNSS